MREGDEDESSFSFLTFLFLFFFPSSLFLLGVALHIEYVLTTRTT